MKSIFHSACAARLLSILIKAFATLLLCCAATTSPAQTPDWLWAKKAGANGIDDAYGIAIDRQGNTFVAGSFQSPAITFGSTSFANAGDDDVFLVKYNAAGAVLWARHAGTITAERAWAVATDSSGNCYIAGNFTNTVTFGSITLNGGGSNSLFVVKYSAAGSVLWAKAAGPTNVGVASARSIAVDKAGNAIITGFCSDDPMAFGPFTVTGTGFGGYDIFVAKYNAAGGEEWVQRPSGTLSDFGQGIATDGAGNCYITGYFESANLSFGAVALSYQYSANRYFTVKYNPAGTALWARSGSGGELVGTAIAADSLGNSYVAGRFSGMMAVFDTITLQNGGYSDAFLVKYDPAGGVAWARNAGGASDDVALGVGVDARGNSYLAGQFFGAGGGVFDSTITVPDGGGSNVFVAKYNDTGAVVWAKGAGGNASGFINAIAVDRAGNSHVAGHFGGVNTSIIFGTTTFASAMGNTIFTAKLSPGEAPTGIGAVSSGASGLSVFPNPTGGRVHMVVHASAALTLTDCLGRAVWHDATTGTRSELTPDWSFLPDGLYLLNCRTAAGVEAIQIVKSSAY